MHPRTKKSVSFKERTPVEHASRPRPASPGFFPDARASSGSRPISIPRKPEPKVRTSEPGMLPFSYKDHVESERLKEARRALTGEPQTPSSKAKDDEDKTLMFGNGARA